MKDLKHHGFFPPSKCRCSYGYCISANAAQNTTDSLIVWKSQRTMCIQLFRAVSNLSVLKQEQQLFLCVALPHTGTRETTQTFESSRSCLPYCRTRRCGVALTSWDWTFLTRAISKFSSSFTAVLRAVAPGWAAVS